MRKLKFLLVVSILLILMVSLIGCSSKVYDVKTQDIDNNLSSYAYNELSFIATAYPDRSIDGNPADFIEYIKSEMGTFGYEVSEQSYTTSNSKTAKNVLASKKKEGASEKIVIGCTWDNNYFSFEEKPDGSYLSGASIAAMLTIADYLQDKELSYNLEFVFFAGGLDGWSGAQYYMSKLTAQDKKDIKLFINLGYIIGGDNQYIYARDKDTNYASFIDQVNVANGISGFSKVPAFKNTFNATITDEQVYDYSHIGMFGNNIVFMNNAIPSINYQSLNWSDLYQPIYVEKSGLENVGQSANDTFDNMSKRSGEDALKAQFQNVIASIIETVYVNQDGLMPILNDADEVNMFTQSDAAYYIFNVAAKIIAAMIIILSVVYAKSQITKNSDEYKKIKEAIPDIKVASDLDELIKMVQGLEEQVNNEEKDNKDNNDKDDNNNSISDDDVFQ